MLNRGPTGVLFKQIIDISKDACNPLKHNVPQLFYNNFEAINQFVQYLHQRYAAFGIRPIKYCDYHKERRLPGTVMSYGAPNMSDFFSFNLRHWFTRKRDEFRRSFERNAYGEQLKLGPDLAAAMFVIKIGGKVKFKGENEWIDKKNKDKISKLPKKFDPNYILDELNLDGYPLRYEHLDFIFNLYSLRSLSLKGCQTIDDWAVDKLSAEFPMVEYLDISECKNVTERGLEALYRMPNLKKLTVTNFKGSSAFDLTCLLLEDINPYLKCEVQQPKYQSLSMK
ncbi:distal membrane arm assembly component 2 [Xylocopa sonorina]|uniref:distal membrane arm assembly component 2 n=1 Tax=Xylocopa sonorina TaxID=1818115 RepID=UPI00403AA0F7